MKEHHKNRELVIDKFYADLWEKDRQQKSMKEEEKAREQIERNRETLKV